MSLRWTRKTRRSDNLDGSSDVYRNYAWCSWSSHSCMSCMCSPSWCSWSSHSGRVVHVFVSVMLVLVAFVRFVCVFGHFRPFRMIVQSIKQ